MLHAFDVSYATLNIRHLHPMAKDTFFRKNITLNIAGKLLNLQQPKVMGIINITPDSFFADSRKTTTESALMQAQKMLTEGADMLDIGAYSSRPGAIDISAQEEIDRLMPVVEAISTNLPNAVLSIDTFRASVAQASVKAGAHIINDIGGGTLDDDMFNMIAKLQVPYILMHMKGTPQTMVKQTQYDDLFGDIFDHLTDKYQQLKRLGVHDVIIDPGFGFAKTQEQSYLLLSRMEEFNRLGLPVLVGVSRKRMVYQITGGSAVDALNGTTVLNTIALSKGTNIIRVHDVKEAVEAVKIWQMSQPA
jgi:dihydropteroate synthase